MKNCGSWPANNNSNACDLSYSSTSLCFLFCWVPGDIVVNNIQIAPTPMHIWDARFVSSALKIDEFPIGATGDPQQNYFLTFFILFLLHFYDPISNDNKTVKAEEASVENAFSETFWEKFLFTFKRRQNKILLRRIWFTPWYLRNLGHLNSPATAGCQNPLLYPCNNWQFIEGRPVTMSFHLDPGVALMRTPFHRERTGAYKNGKWNICIKHDILNLTMYMINHTDYISTENKLYFVENREPKNENQKKIWYLTLNS